MKAIRAILLLIALAPCSNADPVLYRSNSFGMLLEPIQRYRRDQTEWVMEVEKNGANERGGFSITAKRLTVGK